jgi:hypothetical protein
MQLSTVDVQISIEFTQGKTFQPAYNEIHWACDRLKSSNRIYSFRPEVRSQTCVTNCIR